MVYLLGNTVEPIGNLDPRTCNRMPFSWRLYDCVTRGRCSTPLQPDEQAGRAMWSSSGDAFVQSNHAHDDPCTMCRVVGSTVFFGASCYSGTLAMRAARQSMDRRICASLSIAFGLLGLYRAWKR